MAWNIRGKKTEHAGAKHGSGAYWGRKADAKHSSNKERRGNSRRAAAAARDEIAAPDLDGTG
jgi:hypothetical protein